MYTLYWSRASASFAPQALFEEAGLGYVGVEIDIYTGAHRTPDYLAINPAGEVPALVLPDKTVVTESAAICLTVAEAHDLHTLVPPAGDPARPTFLRWLFFLTASVQATYKRFYYPERVATDPAARPQIRDQALLSLNALWRVVDDHLAAGGPFMLGPRFSLLDIYVAMLVDWYPGVDALYARAPAVGGCDARTIARPAIARVLAVGPDGRRTRESVSAIFDSRREG